MWNTVSCSHGCMSYSAFPIVCSGLGDSDAPTGGMSCGVCLSVLAVRYSLKTDSVAISTCQYLSQRPAVMKSTSPPP